MLLFSHSPLGDGSPLSDMSNMQHRSDKLEGTARLVYWMENLIFMLTKHDYSYFYHVVMISAN